MKIGKWEMINGKFLLLPLPNAYCPLPFLLPGYGL